MNPRHGSDGYASRWRILKEGAAAARSQPVASAIAALIMATVCGVVFATTGQGAASEARVLAQVDRAGARTLVFSDPEGSAEITSVHIQEVANLPNVLWALAVGPASDVRNVKLGRAGDPVSARAYYTDLPPVLKVTGRAPRDGEAMVGGDAQATLGLEAAAGAVDGEEGEAPIVAAFETSDPLNDLRNTVLVKSAPSDTTNVQSLFVLAKSVDDVAALEELIPNLVSAQDTSAIAISSPSVLVDLQRVVAGEVGRNGRRTMILVLATGLVLVAITQYGAITSRRRDFGRRRALGASKQDIVTLVVSQVVVAGGLGVLVGTLTGALLVQTLAGAQPRWQFTVGVAFLTLLSAVIASIPPAWSAARSDPVRILRVP